MRLKRFPLAHTFSIIARDPVTGAMGVAVQSHWFSTGSLVTWAEAGVGVIATQSMVEVSYGPLGLDSLRAGKDAKLTLEELLRADEGRDLRQVAVGDSKGGVATHTGKRCIAKAGHITGDGFSVQANMMMNDTVWPAMAEAYRSSQGTLEDRLLLVLEAAQNAGGDIRGQQSAAMLVVEGKSTGKSWEGIRVDLRVEDHPTPIDELKRLLNIQKAYRLMNTGDDLLGKGQVAEALEAYRNARIMLPGQIEFPFWQAVTLADLGRVDEALSIFADIFNTNPNWAELLRRLPAAGLIKNDPEILDQILGLCK
ncbi:MAG: DUF1028 domain-containing protein [Anaerolineaceae bacterium]|nr:DUF1028 domain-containing protein [Anaerolineaceae bacterium]MBN2676953.1 DUF1028 domain-containing protein [Anaerolineaceae bacterium]